MTKISLICDQRRPEYLDCKACWTFKRQGDTCIF